MRRAETPLETEPPSSAEDRWNATVAAACEGSRDAQSRLFAELRAYLYSRAAGTVDRRLQIKLSPSDIVQETLMQAYQSFGTFEGKTRAELILWLQGILNNQVKMANRKYRGTDKRDIRRENRIDEQGSAASRWSPIAGAGKSPSGSLEQRELIAELEQAIARLPERQEQAIRLRNELRLSFEETGKVLGCSAEAARKLWSRAIQQLTRELKDGR